MIRKTIKKRRNRFKLPVVGKYVDTITKSEFKVVYFMDDVGEYKIKIGNLPETILKGCRFHLLGSEVKSKKKFFRKFKPFLDFGIGWNYSQYWPNRPPPEIFGLLKIRKNKVRKFVLFQAADQYFKSKTINIMAIVIDNLLYLDLVNRLKNKA